MWNLKWLLKSVSLRKVSQKSYQKTKRPYPNPLPCKTLHQLQTEIKHGERCVATLEWKFSLNLMLALRDKHCASWLTLAPTGSGSPLMSVDSVVALNALTTKNRLRMHCRATQRFLLHMVLEVRGETTLGKRCVWAPPTHVRTFSASLSALKVWTCLVSMVKAQGFRRLYQMDSWVWARSKSGTIDLICS